MYITRTCLHDVFLSQNVDEYTTGGIGSVYHDQKSQDQPPFSVSAHIVNTLRKHAYVILQYFMAAKIIIFR